MNYTELMNYMKDNGYARTIKQDVERYCRKENIYMPDQVTGKEIGGFLLIDIKGNLRKVDKDGKQYPMNETWTW